MKVLPPLVALRAFDAAARHLSFGKAGAELFVSQSAISRHVRNLEEYLQRPLFVRQGRSVVLTEDGKRYHVQVNEGFGLIQDATACMMTQSRASVLTVDVSPSFSMRWLAPRLHRFSQRHPDIELRLNSSDQASEVTLTGAHIAVRATTRRNAAEVETWPGVYCEYLLPRTLVAVYNPQFIEAPTSLREVPLHPLIATAPHSSAWHDWFRFGGKDEARVRPSLTFRHHYMAIQAAIDGKGIAIVPDVLVEQELEIGTLKTVLHRAETPGAYHLLTPQRRFQDKTVEHFRRWIGQAAGAHRASQKAALFTGKIVSHGKLRAVNGGGQALEAYRA